MNVRVLVSEDGPRLAAARQAPVDPDKLRSRRIVLPGDSGPAAIAYRMLRTQLLRQVRALSLRTIGVIGAADGEGKTLTAVNLALNLAAEPNQTVLLADFDLHRPQLAALLNLPAEQGLDTWLMERAPLDGLFWRLDGVERLLILPTVTRLAGGSELLAGARMKELLHEVEARYSDRIVLLDLPPLLLTDDVLTLAPLLDGVIVVAYEGRTRRDDLDRIRELLADVRIIGTVLNGASEFERRAY